MSSSRTVMARIKRMGNMHAVSGITLRPPEDRVSEPGIKRLCPKLVPGQVVEVPANHNLLQQPGIEIVRNVERDEILRPWVFADAASAQMANPNKSRLGADAIQAGLALSEGSRDHQARKLLQREAAIQAEPDVSRNAAQSLADRLAARRADPRFVAEAESEAQAEVERLRARVAQLEAAADERRDINEPGPADEPEDGDEPEDDGEDYVPTAQNRLAPDEATEITGKEYREPKEKPVDADEQPPVRRTPREPRNQRKPGVSFGRG